MLSKVVCAIVVLLPAIALCANRGSSCTTPNGERAKCIPFTSCKNIKDAVATQNRDAIQFAKDSQCGYDSEPLVCCGTSAEKKSALDSSCTTPNGETARCKPLRSCKVIFDAFSTRKKEAIEFAKNSQCGYDTEPLVCCGSAGSISSINTGTALSPLLPDRTQCGLARSFKVVGGELTEIWEHPWMALLRYKNLDGTDAGFLCGGTVINNRYVLTAAHCVVISTNRGITLDSVRLGEWKISTPKDCEEGVINDECADPVVDLEIEESIPNKQYKIRSGKNDIALLRLERNVTFTDYIRPICLPQPNLPTPAPGTRLVVVGWGVTENRTASDEKLKVELPVVSLSDCTARYKNRGKPISDDQLCAGGEVGKSSCQGDSGGPLMGSFAKRIGEVDQWYQEGVVSAGISCGVLGFPGIFARVSRYMNWINDNLKP